jgi:hypothetical protein
MKMRARYWLLAGLLMVLASCKPTPYDTAPLATDSVDVVGTFVSAKALSAGGHPASIVAMAVDSAGNLYGADRGNSRVLKITPDGLVTTLAGDGSVGYVNGPGASARFDNLVSLAVDKRGTVYVGEGYPNTCIRKIAPDGQVSTFVGKPFDQDSLPFNPETSGDGFRDKARFITPVALVFDSAGNLLVSDIGSFIRYASNAVRRVTPEGDVRTIAGYVSGTPYQGRVVDGSPVPFRFVVLAINRFNSLVGIDNQHYRLYAINQNGDMSSPPQAPLPYPESLLYDQEDQLIMASGSTIRRIGPTGALTILSGSADKGFVNDSLKSARFGYISALALGRNNTLYIADNSNQCIRRVRLGR